MAAARRALVHPRPEIVVDAHVMTRAIGLAMEHRPHPNPRVGAVVIAPDGSVVGEAAHHRSGMPHAEELALEQAGESARGATLYTTLEPCPHVGQTPPCTEAIVASGVSRVVIGALDPDSRVAGRGLGQLSAAGMDVTVGVLEEEVLASDPGYFHHRRTGRPRITLKLAATLDGQIAATDGTSQWITSEEARADAHLMRAESDAVVVGAGTLLVDNPRLTARIDGYEGPQPRPVVILGRRSLPADAHVLGEDLVVVSPASISGLGEDQIVAPDGSGTAVDLDLAMVRLGQLGLLDVLVEGGGKLARSLIEADLVDRVVLYFGAKLAAGAGRQMFQGLFATLSEARTVIIEDVDRVGPDLKVTCRTGEG